MFGNQLGWFISAIIIVALALGLYYIYDLGRPTPPTRFGREAHQLNLAIPANPRDAAAFMNQPGDPAQLYRQVIANYANVRGEPPLRPGPIQQFLQADLDSAAVRDMTQALAPMLEARNMSGTSAIFAATPEQVITYGDRQGLVALLEMGQAARMLGRKHQVADNHAEAQRYYEAAFALGVRLYEERLVFNQLSAGLDLLATVDYLIELARTGDDQPAVERLERFRSARLPYIREQFQPARDTIMRLNAHPGDMVAVAQQGGERLVRIEATLALGRLKFSAERLGDRLAAERIARQLATDPDPTVAHAATLARDLDQPGFRSIRVATGN